MNFILFITTTLIWGSTWLAIKFQLGQVMPLWSLIYRFGIAAIILLGYCAFTQHRLSFNRSQHGWIALQALLTYFLNYIMFYLSTNYFASGIVATIFAIIVVFNIINGRIFLGSPIERKTVLGAILGISGLICIVWAEIIRLEDQNIWQVIEGVALCLVGALSASLGHITVVANAKRGLPIIQTNALGYVYGCIFTLLVALVLKQAPSFDTSWLYVTSLLYLSSFGTVIAFLCYLTLANRIGPEKSAYAFILIPVIAMGLSSFFENLNWTPRIVLGSILVLMGNILVMVKIPMREKLQAPEKSPLSLAS